MEQLLPLEYVTERDIDLLLLEELSVNPSFREAFLRNISADLEDRNEFVGAWHSVIDAALGESDLLLIMDRGGRRHAVLVENKIDAPAQPSQARRYRMRGDAGVQAGRWQVFTACVVAPQRYLHSVEAAKAYEQQVSYERLMELLSHSAGLDSKRVEFRNQLISQAIEQNRRGYTPKHDERVTAFWRNYWQEATILFTELGMREPKSRPSGSDWIEFCSPLLPPGYTLRHKLEFGAVDLQTPRDAGEAATLSASCGSLLHDDLEVVPTGKSCSVRLGVPQLDRRKDYASQRQEAIEGMKAAFRLAWLARAICHALGPQSPNPQQPDEPETEQ